MRLPDLIKRPDRWSTMTKALVGVALVLLIEGVTRAIGWLIG